jgi:hypothetical protein
MHLGSGRDESEHDSLCLGSVGGPQDGDSIRFEGGRRSPDSGVVRRRREATRNLLIDAGLEFGDHEYPSVVCIA